MTPLFGPERIRDSFGIIYEVEILGYVTHAFQGRCYHVEYRKPGEEAWDTGYFRCDRSELLEPLRVEAAA